MSEQLTTSDATKDSEGQRSFLAKVGEDEPIFILRGRDVLAAATIAAWIDLAKRCRVSRAKIRAANDHLALFDDYSLTQTTRLPD